MSNRNDYDLRPKAKCSIFRNRNQSTDKQPRFKGTAIIDENFAKAVAFAYQQKKKLPIDLQEQVEIKLSIAQFANGMSDSPQKGETKDGKPFDYFYLAIEPFVQGMDSFWDDYQRAMSGGSDEDHNQDEPDYPPEQSSDVSDFEEDIPF
tara:strand:- start:1627 stop:2073 length:447 start_codon:yes stop_codon:yes gene_type:complete